MEDTKQEELYYQIPQCVICWEICLKDLKAVNCGHVFHKECLDDYKIQQVQRKCPICREFIQNDSCIKLNYQITKQILAKNRGSQNRQKFQTSQNQFVDLEQKLQNMKGHLTQLQNKLNSHEKHKEVLKGKIVSFMSQIKDLEKQLKLKSKIIQDLKSENQKMTMQQDQQFKLQEELEEFQKQQESQKHLEINLDKIGNNLSSEHIKNLKGLLSQKNLQIQTLKEENSQFFQQNQSLINKNQKIKQKLEKQQLSEKESQKESNNYKKTNEILRKKIKTLQQMIRGDQTNVQKPTSKTSNNFFLQKNDSVFSNSVYNNDIQLKNDTIPKRDYTYFNSRNNILTNEKYTYPFNSSTSNYFAKKSFQKNEQKEKKQTKFSNHKTNHN